MAPEALDPPAPTPDDLGRRGSGQELPTSPGHGEGDADYKHRVVSEVHEATHFGLAEIEALYEKFWEHARPGREVDCGTFCRSLGHAFGADENDELLELIFRSLDEADRGYVAFPAFAQGLHVFFRGTDEEALEFFFKMYDTDRDGVLYRSDLEAMLRGVARQHGESFGQSKWTTPLADLIELIFQGPGGAGGTGVPSPVQSRDPGGEEQGRRARTAEARNLLIKFAEKRYRAGQAGLTREEHQSLERMVGELPPSDPASAVRPFLGQPFADSHGLLYAHAPWREFLFSVGTAMAATEADESCLDFEGFKSAMLRVQILPTRSHRALGVRPPAHFQNVYEGVSETSTLEATSRAAEITLGLGGGGGGLSAHFHGEDSLQDLSLEEREVFALLGEERVFEDGEGIITEGGHLRAFHFVLEGHVCLMREGLEIDTQGPGSFIGESALFLGDLKKANADGSVTITTSVKAVGPVRTWRVDTRSFFPLVFHEHQGAARLMQKLGQAMVGRLEALEELILNSESTASAMTGLRVSKKDFAAVRKLVLSTWSLKYHKIGKKGKIETVPTKSVGTAHDLSVAYSPGVAEPCVAIQKNPAQVYEYTNKGHLVGVVTNGSAVLGLGNIGALASKPVMEGKAVLFKTFADIDAYDIELKVAAEHPHLLCEVVAALEPTFGGINLEDIKAPECFMVERQCQERMDIPVFHDDQHGTAIIAGAAMLNALELVGKSMGDVRIVVCGCGAAGFTCAKFFVALGAKRSNILPVDIDGVVYQGREDLRDGSYLNEVAVDTDKRTLAEAVAGSDVFVGLSAAGLLKPEMLLSMQRDPIVFALANPNPEITPSLARETRGDVIIATGRSDFPNQVNNCTAFPYIFRGALDCRARKVNEAMKLGAARAIAALAKTADGLDLSPDEEEADYQLCRDYLIPKPTDPRLLVEVSVAVAAAARDSGVAREALDDGEYRLRLRDRQEQMALSTGVSM